MSRWDRERLADVLAAAWRVEATVQHDLPPLVAAVERLVERLEPLPSRALGVGKGDAKGPGLPGPVQRLLRLLAEAA